MQTLLSEAPSGCAQQQGVPDLVPESLPGLGAYKGIGLTVWTSLPSCCLADACYTLRGGGSPYLDCGAGVVAVLVRSDPTGAD